MDQGTEIIFLHVVSVISWDIEIGIVGWMGLWTTWEYLTSEGITMLEEGTIMLVELGMRSLIKYL